MELRKRHSKKISDICGLFNILLLLSMLSLLIIFFIKNYIESQNEEVDEKIRRNYTKKDSEKKTNKQKNDAEKKKESLDIKDKVGNTKNEDLISAEKLNKKSLQNKIGVNLEMQNIPINTNRKEIELIELKPEKEIFENYEDCLDKINQVYKNCNEDLKLEVNYSENFEIVEKDLINFNENKEEINLYLNTSLVLINDNELDVIEINNDEEEWNFVETFI